MKRIATALIIVLSYISISAQVAPPPPPPPPPPPEPNEEIFKVVEKMPRFPGCSDMDAPESEKNNCASQKMLEFLYKNIQYPAEAKEAGVEGMCIVQFTVVKDGSLENINLVRDIGKGCGDEAIRVVNMMNQMPDKWEPGTQRQRPVKVLYTLPIKFALDKEAPKEKPNGIDLEKKLMQGKPSRMEQNKVLDTKDTDVELAEEKPAMEEEMPVFEDTTVEEEMPVLEDQGMEEEVFKVVEEMPRFPGCEGNKMNQIEMQRCAEGEMLKFIYSRLKYPAEARENGVEGMCIVEFVVEKDGTVSSPRISRDIGAGCGEACLDIVNSMNKENIRWKPGIQRGNPVRVKYILPVKFKLEGPSTKKLQGRKGNK